MHNVNKSLTEHGDKIDDATKEEVKKAIEEAQAITSSSDLETVKAKSAALSAASMKIGQAVYGKKDGAAGAAPAADDAAASNAQNADFEEKDKK